MPDADYDVPCIHVSVSLIYAPPGGRWACDECGEQFHPASRACALPPGPGVEDVDDFLTAYDNQPGIDTTVIPPGVGA